MELDRKVVVALTAKKLRDVAEELMSECESSIKLALDVDSDTFRNYLLDVVAEACQLIKEKSAK